MYINLFLNYSFKRLLKRVMLRSAQSQRCTFPESRPCPGLHQRAQSLIPVQDVHRPGPEGLMTGGYFPFLLISSSPEYDGDNECHHILFSSTKSLWSAHSLTGKPRTPLIWKHAARILMVCVRLRSLPGGYSPRLQNRTAPPPGAGSLRSEVIPGIPDQEAAPRDSGSGQQTGLGGWALVERTALPSAEQLCRTYRWFPTCVTSGAATPLWGALPGEKVARWRKMHPPHACTAGAKMLNPTAEISLGKEMTVSIQRMATINQVYPYLLMCKNVRVLLNENFTKQYIILPRTPHSTLD